MSAASETKSVYPVPEYGGTNQFMESVHEDEQFVNID